MARGVARAPRHAAGGCAHVRTVRARNEHQRARTQIIALGCDLAERLGVVVGHMENLGKSQGWKLLQQGSSMENRLCPKARP